MNQPNVLPAPGTGLSSIIKAEAKIAMPEVVDIFLSKYETKLYDKKDMLQKALAQIEKDQEMHTAVVLKSAKHKHLVGLKMPKLNLVSYLIKDPSLNWDSKQITINIGLHNVQPTDTKDEDWGYGAKDTGFDKAYQQDISENQINAHEKMKAQKAQLREDLQITVSKIGDMSRKERQVKAQISELRLEEQGLQDFVNNADLLQLIKID